MISAHLDFECRSRIDLKKCGVYRYAMDASTEVLCLAYKVDDGPIKTWRVDSPDDMAELRELAENSDVIFYAFNAMFERLIWRYVMTRDWGMPDIPINRWRCVAAQAAALALPRNLEEVAKIMRCPTQKDKGGYRLIQMFSIPIKKGARKGEFNEPMGGDFDFFCRYNSTDVQAEYEAHHRMRPLPESEELVWQMDQRINDRGIKVDS